MKVKTMATKAMTITMAMARGTATMMGLAVMLAVVFGAGSTALAAVPGDPLKLGRINAVDALTQLIGTRNNALLRIENDSKGTSATALELQVDPKRPPIKTNSLTKVENLHADLLDGRSADQFANGIGGTAVDADKLDGKDSTAFASGTGGTANDADRLDGKDSAGYFSGTFYDRIKSDTGPGNGFDNLVGADCDQGDVALGGGGDLLSVNSSDYLVATGPGVASEGRSWFARFRDDGAASVHAAWVRCADFPPLRP
jgi:hypothetical protein